MRAIIATGMLAVALSGCGSDDADEREEPMKVEDTVFAPVVTAPERAGERANAAVDQHRRSLDERLEQDEGGEEPPAED
jgi:hypothetical protein